MRINWAGIIAALLLLPLLAGLGYFIGPSLFGGGSALRFAIAGGVLGILFGLMATPSKSRTKQN